MLLQERYHEIVLQLEHLAKLSLLRLPSSEAGLKKLQADLEKILRFARKVQHDAAVYASAETSAAAQWQGGVPLSLAASATLPDVGSLPDECSTMHLLRDDSIRDLIDREFLLDNCPEHEHGYISVPKSIER